MMLAKAYEVLQQNLTDTPHKIIEKVQLLLGDKMSSAERHALQTVIARKRTDILGHQSKDVNDLVVPDHLSVTATPVDVICHVVEKHVSSVSSGAKQKVCGRKLCQAGANSGLMQRDNAFSSASVVSRAVSLKPAAKGE